MTKIFVLVNDWVYDLDPDMNVETFDTLDKAISAMRWGIDIWRKQNKDTDWDFNEGELHASFSEDGRWQENHIAWTIYEREVGDPDEFALPQMVVSRADLEEKGFDTTNVDDDTMKIIAAKMGNYILDYEFWDALQEAASNLGLQKTCINED